MDEGAGRQRIFVVGTRAQLIKVAPVVVACERAGQAATMLMTGQHRETMQDLVEEFGIRSPQVAAIAAGEHSTIGALVKWLPRAYSGVASHLRELARGHSGLDVLVHGDTLSTLVGAVAGRRCGARVVHLESGLSSGRLFDPFPEEISRRLVFRAAHVAMCPGPVEAAYMHRHHPQCRVVDTGGNTIVDAVALVGASPADRDPSRPYLVASLHRFQNLYQAGRLRQLTQLVATLSRRYPVHFVLHPATRNRLGREGLLPALEAEPGVTLSPRLGYGAFLRLAAGAACVLTDGGSNQEELAALGVPTLVMRARTERSDGLGANALMEADAPGGVEAFVLGGGFESLRCPPRPPPVPGPSQRIVEALAT